MIIRHSLATVLALALCASQSTAFIPCGSRPEIDVRVDLTKLAIHEANAAGDGETDDSPALQAAIDHVARLGGGTVVVPPGTYRVAGVEVKPGVRLLGAGREKTVFRALHTGVMFSPKGGYLGNFPEQFNDIEPDEPGQRTTRGEKDHPVAQPEPVQ